MGKTLKRSTKIWIIILVVFLVLAVVALSLTFGWINDFRYLTYTKARVKKAAVAYASHPMQFVAHRGLSDEAFQNTARAFELAAECEGVWAIETDVWVTKDGGFVCMHDKNALKGVSDVADITLEEALRTPLRKSESDFAPSLEEYLRIAMEGGKVALIELKDKKMSEESIDLLLDRVAATGADVRIISFHFNLLKYIRSKDDEMGLWYLYNLFLSGDIPGGTRKKKLDALISLKMDVGINSMFMKKSDVKRMHAAGRQVNAWTVNSAKSAVLFADEFNVDYLTSDIRMYDEVNKLLADYGAL